MRNADPPLPRAGTDDSHPSHISNLGGNGLSRGPLNPNDHVNSHLTKSQILSD